MKTKNCIAKVVLLLLATCFYCSRVESQNLITLSGYVTDSESGEALIAANIHDEDNSNITWTNSEGFFVLVFEDGEEVKVEVSYVGYKSEFLKIESDTFLTVCLRQDTLGTVLVTATQEGRSSLEVIQLQAKQLNYMPLIMGERDLFKGLTLLPGVGFGIEGRSEVTVRGGTSDQNLILYDDVPLYSSGHLLGFISIFNPLAVKSVRLYKGQFPSRYGGRLSSVIDVASRDPNIHGIKGEYSFGLINSQFNVNGLFSEKIRFSFSGRVANLGLILLPIKLLYKKKSIENYGNFFMNDYNAKIKYALDDRRIISTSILLGRDNGIFLNQDLDEDIEYDNRFRWGNSVYSAKYSQIVSPKMYFQIVAFVSGYKNNKYSVNQYEGEVFEYRDKSVLTESGMRADCELKMIRSQELKMGFYISRFSSLSNAVSIQQPGSQDELNSPGSKQNLYSVSPYISTDFSHGSFLVRPGLRLSHYFHPGYNRTIVEPRATLQWAHRTGIIGFNYARLSQPMHLATGLISDLPVSSWIVSSTELPVSTASSFSAHFTNKSKESNNFEIGLFYRNYHELSDFPLGTQFVYNADNSLVELLAKNGIGRSYGLELLYEKKNGKTQGWISTTLSKSERRFEGINDNNWYKTQYQRDLQGAIYISHQLNRRHHLSTTAILGSGIPVTYPEGFSIAHPDYNNSRLYPRITPVYSRKHNGRSRKYFRIDVQYRIALSTKNDRDSYLAFGVYNISGHRNSIASEVRGDYQLDLDRIDAGVPGILRGELIETTIFNFIPFVNFGKKIEFK